jgi:hypothetical protein
VNGLSDRIARMAHNNNKVARFQRERCCQNMPNQGNTGEMVEHFGRGGFHPGALPGS